MAGLAFMAYGLSQKPTFELATVYPSVDRTLAYTQQFTLGFKVSKELIEDDLYVTKG